MLGQRLQRWVNISSTEARRGVGDNRPIVERFYRWIIIRREVRYPWKHWPMLGQCWHTSMTATPALTQHWVDVCQNRWPQGDWFLSVPTNTRHWTNVVLMLGHRLRQWPSIKATLGEWLAVMDDWEGRHEGVLWSTCNQGNCCGMPVVK